MSASIIHLPLSAPTLESTPAEELLERVEFLTEAAEEMGTYVVGLEQANARLAAERNEAFRAFAIAADAADMRAQQQHAAEAQLEEAVRLLGEERLRTDALERRVAELERQLGEVLP